MNGLSQRNMQVRTNQFSMVPRGDIPRSTFATEHAHKTTFSAGRLVPFHLDEVLPGDVHQGEVTLFARLATPLFPIMDNVELETFFFFVPARLLWANWVKFMGERENPNDSIAYTIPQMVTPAGGFAPYSLGDYLGAPVAPQLGANTKSINALPFRAYSRIWYEWFRDENLQGAPTLSTGDGPDANNAHFLLNRAKRHDYFTSALPWPTKGGVIPNIPLAGTANVFGIAVNRATDPTNGTPANAYEAGPVSPAGWAGFIPGNTANGIYFRTSTDAVDSAPAIWADLSTATGVALNAMRLAVATQQLLEKDARGGTRYTELLRNHFGVTPEDSRLQRPEYIGGGRSPIRTQAIPQTAPANVGTPTPLGVLGASAFGTGEHRFSYSATEHGYIIGLVNVRADVTYQQGLHRLFTRQTRYDFYWPSFAHLGEQVVRNDEIFVQGSAADTGAFGYQERWAEYRHRPSRLSGAFRSTTSPNIDEWHLAEQFGSLPVLGNTFLEDASAAVLRRAFAAGAQADSQQVLLDSLFRIRCTRPVPMFSVPGLDRF